MKILFAIVIAPALWIDVVAQLKVEPPDLQQLQGLIGKRHDDSDIRAFIQSDIMSLYQKKQITNRLPSGRLEQRTSVQYGGDGFLLIIEEDGLVDVSTGEVNVLRPAAVMAVHLICGNCEEAERFGKWKGNLPKAVQLPDNPSSLLQQHNEADVDREEIINSGQLELSRRRRIYFGGPIPENVSYPYGFIFDDNQFSILVLLPIRKTITIPPIKSSNQPK